MSRDLFSGASNGEEAVMVPIHNYSGDVTAEVEAGKTTVRQFKSDIFRTPEGKRAPEWLLSVIEHKTKVAATEGDGEEGKNAFERASAARESIVSEVGALVLRSSGKRYSGVSSASVARRFSTLSGDVGEELSRSMKDDEVFQGNEIEKECETRGRSGEEKGLEEAVGRFEFRYTAVVHYAPDVGSYEDVKFDVKRCVEHIFQSDCPGPADAGEEPSWQYQAAQHFADGATGMNLEELISDDERGAGVDFNSFYEVLRTNSTVTKVIMPACRVGDQSAAAIAEALKVNSTITELDLSGNGIGEQGAAALAEALRVNSAITELDLSGNEIGAQGAAAIAEVEKRLQRNRDLKEKQSVG